MSHDGQTAPRPRPLKESVASYPWTRIFGALFFFFVLWLAMWVMILVGIAQLALRLFDADGSDDLREFSGRVGTYLGEICDYLGFAREKAPFPFSRFPTA